MRKLTSFLVGLFTLAAVIILAYCLYRLVPKFLEYKASDDAYNKIRNEAVRPADSSVTPLPDETLEEVSSEKTSETDDVDRSDALWIDWDAFAGTEIVAWLQLGEISYPIMQASDNEKYLHHLPDGSYNYGGSIFLYNKNNPLFTDQNSFVYGHNMANGSMFGTLKQYADPSKKDSCFYVYLPDGTRRKYRFFSVMSVMDHSQAYTWTFASDDTFLEYQQWCKKQSLYENSPQPSKDARYVSLSTCNGYAGTNQRLVVQGQLERVDQIQEPASWYEEWLEKNNEALQARNEKVKELRQLKNDFLDAKRKLFYDSTR